MQDRYKKVFIQIDGTTRIIRKIQEKEAKSRVFLSTEHRFSIYKFFFYMIISKLHRAWLRGETSEGV